MAALILSSPAFSASKKKKKSKNEEPAKVEAPAEESQQTSLDDTSYSIKLPSAKRDFFYKIDAAVLTGVQNGSPDSLREAMSLMRKKSIEFDESEKVLAAVSAEIMKLVWPSEKITWDIPVITDENPYMGAISSVKQGVFDSSTGNVDFLTTLLPALVIMNNNSDISILEPCENAIQTALQIQSDSVLANYLMAKLYERKRSFENAEKYMALAYTASPKTTEINLAYSRILRANGKLAEASQILNSIDNTSNDIAVLKQNAYIAFDAGEYDSAEMYVARVLQQTPNDLEFLLFRAKILVEKKDYIHAVSLLDVYARQDSSSIDYLVLRARVQLDWSKNTAAASETVEKALQMYPDNVDALMFAARISSETDSPVAGKYADELAARVLEKKPGNQEAMTYALDGLIHRENWQEAYTASRNLISSGNVSPAVVEKYVKVCLELGKNAEAYDYAKARYDANPSDELLLESYILAYFIIEEVISS